MDTNLVSNLREIRERLTDNVRGMERLGRKMTGPQSKDQSSASAPSQDSIQSLVTDIGNLSSYLNKLLEQAHAFVGEFNIAAEAPSPARFG